MMDRNICEYLRRKSVESCFELSAFRKCWPIWKEKIQLLLADEINERDILNIGDNLSEVFLSTRDTGRSQESLSGGGYGWEGLVCWYLNLCLLGSRAVAIRKTSDLPSPLRSGISVNYGNFRSNTEADLIIVVFPNLEDFTSTSSLNSISPANTRSNEKKRISQNIDNLVDEHFEKIELGVVQCKTNWNDNAQIPMLWSMIYQASDFKDSSISVGSNGFSIHDLKHFSYSFCTVPTNSLDNYKSDSTSVNRVRNLSGGNYWGFPTKSGIASSMKEIFNNNFRHAFDSNQRTTLKNSLIELNVHGAANYFNLM